MNEFNYPYNDYQHFTTINTVGYDFCACCLTKNVPFVNLTTCNHHEFFEIITNFKIDYPVSFVCQVCHSKLKKFSQFKQQIEETLKLLDKQVIPQQTSYNSNLKRTPIEISYTIDSQPIAVEIKDETTNQEPVFDTLTVVKVEQCESGSDFEIELPLSEIKKEITGKEKSKKRKIVRRKDKGKKPQSIQKEQSNVKAILYDGKIKAISLTTEELMLERELERNKPSYLKLLYKCENCVIGFDYEDNLTNHLAMRHTEKPGSLLCDVCKSYLSTEGSYKEHCRKHLRRYVCEACGVRYNTERAIVNHYKQEHGEIHTEFNCHLCEFTTPSWRKFRYHHDKHKEKVKCSTCGKSFVNKTGLKVHMLSVHSQSSRVFACKSCDKVYKAKSGLLAHAASAHGAPAAYCVPCRAHFKCHATLRHHLMTHSRHRTESSLKFVCDDCGSKFLTKTDLQTHIDWAHLNTTKHQCGKCSKVFKTARNLRRHEEFVHEKKRLPRDKICDHCGRGFTTLAILKTHQRTHTGERPLRCDTCGASFAHPGALYTHNKLLHNKPAA